MWYRLDAAADFKLVPSDDDEDQHRYIRYWHRDVLVEPSKRWFYLVSLLTGTRQKLREDRWVIQYSVDPMDATIWYQFDHRPDAFNWRQVDESEVPGYRRVGESVATPAGKEGPPAEKTPPA